MNILEHFPLQDLTTFGTGGVARYFASPRNGEEVRDYIAFAKGTNLPFFVLGGGSNVLIADGALDLCVMSSKLLNKIEIMEETEANLVLQLGAGVTTKSLLALSLEYSLTGAEFLTGIPGTVGGALWGNAGAQGQTLEQIFSSALVVTKDNNIASVTKDDLQFSYRKLLWNDEPLCITSIVLTMPKSSQKEIKRKIAHFAACKKGQPIGTKTAGCVFKNPSSTISAGKMIDQIGAKGFKIGGAVVSPCHANFVENKDFATSADIYNLTRLVRQKIQERFGITLEYEIKFIGRF